MSLPQARDTLGVQQATDTGNPVPTGNEPEQDQKSEEQEQKQYEPYVHGIRPGTSAQVTPLKHVNMFRKHFTEENVERAIAYLKSDGESLGVPIFMVVDTRGEWSHEGKKLFWQASDGSTNRLEVVTAEALPDFIKAKWYQQDLPSGIISLHKAICEQYLGVSRPVLAKFIKKQKPWQMIKNMPTKGKNRLSVLAKRPFVFIEIDIADMISFGQTHSKDDQRYMLVLCDNFSGYCMAEIQNTKESPETLRSFKKMLS